MEASARGRIAGDASGGSRTMTEQGGSRSSRRGGSFRIKSQKGSSARRKEDESEEISESFSSEEDDKTQPTFWQEIREFESLPEHVQKAITGG